MAEPKHLFRIVIGAYSAVELAASATSDLCRGGLSATQVCLIGKAPLPRRPEEVATPDVNWPEVVNPEAVDRREVAGQLVEVSAPALFDQVWKDAAASESSLAPWMTRAQSKAILDSLGSGALLLLVSAASASEQVRASQIQLGHHPSIVQSYSFVV